MMAILIFGLVAFLLVMTVQWAGEYKDNNTPIEWQDEPDYKVLK